MAERQHGGVVSGVQTWTAKLSTGRPKGWILAGLIGGLFSVGLPAPAFADLKLCNVTASRVGVAIGYRDQDGWVAEGWWNIQSQSCETILVGSLRSRFYYVHAVDYDRGGEWSGQSFMCTDKKAFTIREIDDCDSRGYARTGFFEVDTRDETDWTIRLTEPEGTAPAPTTKPADSDAEASGN